MTKLVVQIIAAVAATGVICCAAALIVGVHSPEEAKNATPERVPEEVRGGESMTSEELMERAQEIYASWHRSGIVERALEEANMTPDELPNDVTEEVKATVQFEDIIRTWKFDPRNKQVVIHASLALNEEHETELNAVQGRQVGGWTFKVVHDLDYEKEYERELEQLAAELAQLREDHPELEISGFMTSSTEIDMWVHNLTPGNEALNGTVIHNRTVQIYWSPIDSAIRMAIEEAGW